LWFVIAPPAPGRSPLMPLPDGGDGQRLRGDDAVETFLALTARLKRTVLVRTPLPTGRPLLAPRMNESMMPGTQRCDTVLVREHRPSFGDRFHVMNMQEAFAASYQVRESALSVNDARAECPPGLGVVQGVHPQPRISNQLWAAPSPSFCLK
jgi:hypothetical protein